MPRKSKAKKHKHKFRKTKRRYHNGGNRDNIKCCMCETIVDKGKTFIPRKCLTKYGQKAAHRICEKCWWNEFAEEDAKHECPGCVKGLPLTKYKKEAPIVVDLTED